MSRPPPSPVLHICSLLGFALACSSSEADLARDVREHAAAQAGGVHKNPVTISQVNAQLFLGPPGTGAPFHFHHDAINVAAWGSRQWFFQPPDDAEYSVEPPLDWYRRRQEAGVRELQCLQHAGDVVFVPAEWGHSTLNIEASVGVAFELRVRGA